MSPAGVHIQVTGQKVQFESLNDPVAIRLDRAAIP